MSPITEEELVRFLLSCIRHSNSGKIDFNEVANECGIVTRGAAAKRYERLVKSYEASLAKPAKDDSVTAGDNASASANGGKSPAKGKASPKKGDKACQSPKQPGKRKSTESGSSPRKATPSKKAKVMKGAAVAHAETIVKKNGGKAADSEQLSDVEYDQASDDYVDEEEETTHV